MTDASASPSPRTVWTLLGAIAWSYHLLSVHEQRLFRGLSVFVDGCTLEAITAVLGSDLPDAQPLQQAVFMRLCSPPAASGMMWSSSGALSS